jgi:hypothetical protein
MGRLLTAAVVAALTTLVAATPATARGMTPAATKQWAKLYDGPGKSGDIARALEVSPDGSLVFVTGESVGDATALDYATVAYDATSGAMVWTSRYNGPANGDDLATSLGVSPDGTEVFIAGSSHRGSSRRAQDYATVAYDATNGATLWTSSYNGPVNRADFAKALGVSPDGSQVFVTGQSRGPTSFDYATVAYDARTGAMLWARRNNGPIAGFDSATALGVRPDGMRLYVTGTSDGGPRTVEDYATIAYEARTGTKLWGRRYNGPAGNRDDLDLPRSLAVSPDGSQVFVTGESVGAGTSWDYATLAYDATRGARRWTSRYSGPSFDDRAASLGVSPDGTAVFVTGVSLGTSSYDYATVAYNADTGAEVWVSRFNGRANGFDTATALGVSPDGIEVFVTGQSRGPSFYGYATAGYDATTGGTEWVKRYGPGDGFATALGVSPDGSAVFVTGTSLSDYGTVAYAP